MPGPSVDAGPATRAGDWVYSSPPEVWEAALAARRNRLLGELAALARELRAADAPRPDGMERFLRHPHPIKDRLLLHPAFHRWLSHAWRLLQDGSRARSALQRHLNAFQGFSSALALRAGGDEPIAAVCDGAGHVHLHGLGCFLDFGPGSAGTKVKLRAAGGSLQALGPRALKPKLRRLPLISGTLELEDCDPLVLAPFRQSRQAFEHPVARLSEAGRRRFQSVLSQALERIRALDPRLHEELTADIRTVVPLENKVKVTSVSSTYSDLHGAIGLSHCPDVLVQAETLIHEFSHNKLNMLLESAPVFAEDSPRGADFYSPWRRDPRPLQGLLLGAHAFLNTVRFAAAAQDPALAPDRLRRLRLDAWKGLLRSEQALRTLSRHASFTPFGQEFVRSLAAAAAGLHREANSWPADTLEEARRDLAEHRKICAGSRA